MSGHRKPSFGLERRLATTLQLGTWVGSCIIAVGWVLSATGEPPSIPTAAVAIVRAGIVLFILDGRRLCLRAPLPLRRHRITRAGSHRCGGGVRSAHGRRRARLEKRLTCMAAETLAILEV
jgi:hypothetical protein